MYWYLSRFERGDYLTPYFVVNYYWIELGRQISYTKNKKVI